MVELIFHGKIIFFHYLKQAINCLPCILLIIFCNLEELNLLKQPMKPIKPTVIIVEDNELLRDGIQSIIQHSGCAEVLATASNGLEYLELLKKNKPDLVLMDIEMPVMDGIEATSLSISKFPDLKILAISMHTEQSYYAQMLEAGARGYVLKSTNKEELIKAVQDVANDKLYFSNELLNDIIVDFKNTHCIINKEEELQFSNREIEIIDLMCKGYSTIEISERICLSNKTVENYRVKLLNKTGCKNSVSLAVYAIKNNLVSI